MISEKEYLIITRAIDLSKVDYFDCAVLELCENFLDSVDIEEFDRPLSVIVNEYLEKLLSNITEEYL